MSKWCPDQFLKDWKKMSAWEKMCNEDEYETAVMCKTLSRYTPEELAEKYEQYSRKSQKDKQ